MRQAIRITINPEMALSKHGASTFGISFSYRSKKQAVDTVNALIARFIQESTNTQRDQQDTVQSLVSDELAQSKADLEQKNEALTKFRKDNEGRLPEQESMNIQALQSVQTQLNGVNQDLQQLANQRLTIESQITQLEQQLKLNQSMAQEFSELTPLPTTPSVARQNDDLLALNKQIEANEMQLQQLKQKYKSSHPDIRSLESSLKVMQQQRDALVAKQTQQQAADDSKPKAAAPKKATNYRAMESEAAIESQIAQYRTRLTINDRETDERHKQQDDLNKQLVSYRERLAATSLIEAQYADLKRDQAAAADKYEKFQRQKDMTNQSQELISRRATEYLDTLDQPTTPQKPSSPKRGLIIGAGMGISLMLGLALAGLQEARDSSLKNLKDVRAYTNLPVLCSIPLLENTLLVKRKRRITYLAWSAAVIVGILAVCGSLFYYSTVIANT
jgi:uncharacterized protein involved in exopolysaccharide biosynthesis